MSAIEIKYKLSLAIENIAKNPEKYIQEMGKKGKKSLDCLMDLVDDAYKMHREVCDAAAKSKPKEEIASFDLTESLITFKAVYDKYYNSGIIGLINRIVQAVQNFFGFETTTSRYENLFHGSRDSHRSYHIIVLPSTSEEMSRLIPEIPEISKYSLYQEN